MIPELGQYALILALCLGITQVVFSFWGISRPDSSWIKVVRNTSVAQFVFVGLSFFLLAFCFLNNDFSVAYVANNSNTHLPAIFRFCAVWGAHEGSLLLWVFILSGWMAAVSYFCRNIEADILIRVLGVMAMVAIGFYLFILFTSNPFARLLPNIPSNGQDLNPILQDPGLTIHPPMLYMGYVGFSVAFAFAIAALMNQRKDILWARYARPWALFAWTFLTFGIVLGSWWAYRELGWGGFWFWDPVENASFMPWLAGTALIHSLMVTEKRNAFQAWTILLAICTFSLSLLGTFLVRSGVLVSVHAFASDPRRGLFMLEFLCLVIGSSLALYAWRGRHFENVEPFDAWSRETMLLANNVLLFVAMLTVLLGTLYPLIIDSLNLGKISVGPPYFNFVFIPIMLPLLFLMGMGPLFRWQSAERVPIIKRAIWMLIITTLLSFIFIWISGAAFKLSAFITVSVAIWIISNTLSFLTRIKTPKNTAQKTFSTLNWAMWLAHLGMGVTLLGLVGTTMYGQGRELVMHLGEQSSIGGYQFTLNALTDLTGPNYQGVQAQVLVQKNNQILTVLYPQLRNFSTAQTTLSKTAIDVGIFRDLYVALGSPLNANTWELRIYYKPFVRWIWSGGLLMMLGGLLGVIQTRWRRRENNIPMEGEN